MGGAIRWGGEGGGDIQRTPGVEWPVAEETLTGFYFEGEWCTTAD